MYVLNTLTQYPVWLTWRRWVAVRDLLQPDQQPAVRQLTLDFVCKLLKQRQEEVSVLMRASMFEVLRCQDIGEDTPFVLEVLIQLTRMGQDIEFLEAHISAFLIDILPTCLKYG